MAHKPMAAWPLAYERDGRGKVAHFDITRLSMYSPGAPVESRRRWLPCISVTTSPAVMAAPQACAPRGIALDRERNAVEHDRFAG